MSYKKLELKLYSNIKSIPVEWLWYPYIPFGKITLIQGDPGEGKSTMIMALIAALSSGTSTPDGKEIDKPLRIIYQCSEDGVADTIKPRLEKCGANCENIAFVDEDIDPLSLDDDRFRDAIIDFRARVLVIDPFQAYVGEGTNIADAVKIRKIMHRLSLWASAYDCAVILVGHLNKREGSKELYRALGSVDVVAAARSVLQVGRISDDSTTRYVRQIKNSLAPLAPGAVFDINPTDGFQWVECDPVNNDWFYTDNTPGISKEEQAVYELKDLLKNGPVEASDIEEHFIMKGISMRTVYKTKAAIGVRSFRKGRAWYWALSNVDE